MSDPKCARMMIEAAGRDLRSLRLLADKGDEETFGFHLQQAAEKAIKAWIATLGGTYRLTHSIAELLQQLTECGADSADIERFRDLEGATPLAVEFRYEGVAPWLQPLDRDAAIRLASDLLANVEAELGDRPDRD